MLKMFQDKPQSKAFYEKKWKESSHDHNNGRRLFGASQSCTCKQCWSGKTGQKVTVKLDASSGRTVLSANHDGTSVSLWTTDTGDRQKWLIDDKGTHAVLRPTSPALTDCRNSRSFPDSSLQKSGNANFQRSAWDYGCEQGDQSPSTADCETACGGGGCCQTSSCSSNSCSGGGCCSAAQNICTTACNAYFTHAMTRVWMTAASDGTDIHLASKNTAADSHWVVHDRGTHVNIRTHSNAQSQSRVWLGPNSDGSDLGLWTEHSIAGANHKWKITCVS